jgi:3-isopropylmalate dehydratase small subunit
MKIKGKAWKFEDDVDTDAIIAARHLALTDPEELGRLLMETIRPGFPGEVSPGDLIVAGKNFGCGSSREHAPLAIKGAGIAAVLAVNFARIFYRNSFNMGLPIFECAPAARDIQEGDLIEIDAGSGRIRDLTRKTSYQAQPIPPFMRELLSAGGLMNFMVARHNAKRRVHSA